MAIGTDFEVQADGDIRHVANSTHYTVIDFHRWLGTLMDDAAAAGDDILDITDATASERSTDNIITLKAPFNIDDTAAQYLYDGSIIQKGGDEFYDGLVVIAGAGMYLQIVQNGALITPNYWTTAWNADSANGISHRLMVKVRTAGADIDGRRLIGQTREWGYTYSEFKINGTSRGNNVMALTYATDLNNQTIVGTIAGYNDITNTEGYRNIHVNTDVANMYFFSEWNKASHTINEFYERMKWVTRRASGTTLYGLNGELLRGITHEIDVDNQSATDFSVTEKVTWPTGGEGWMLAVNDVNTPTKMWIQLTKGTAPTDGVLITGATSTASCQVNVTVTERSLSFPWAGASTGSSIIGAYGFGVEAGDLTSTDKLFDLTTAQRVPPNNVTFIVGGLINGEDRVLVTALAYSIDYNTELNGPFVDGSTLTFSGGGTAKLLILTDNGDTGNMVVRMLTGTVPLAAETITAGAVTAIVAAAPVPTIDSEQLTLNGELNTTTTTVTVNEVIPTDTPTAGTIRILRANGVYSLHPYSAYSSAGKTFTITSHNFAGNIAVTLNGVFISYIDALYDGTTATDRFTGVYSANRNLFIRVRDGAASPIKTFETTGVLGSAGGSSTAIRTSDT